MKFSLTGPATLKRGAALPALLAASLVLASCSTGGASSEQSLKGPDGKKLSEIVLEDPSYPSAGVDVPGLRGQRILSSLGAAARWDSLPANPAFNAAVSQTVKSQLDAYAESVGSVYLPEAQPVEAGLAERGCIPGSSFLPPDQILEDPQLSPPAEGRTLSIVCDIVLAAGDNFGQRLRFVRGENGQVTSDTVETLYTSLAGDSVLRESELLAEDALPQLYGASAPLFAPRIGLSAEDLLPAEQGAPLLRAHVSSVQFDDNGAVVITVDAGFLQQQLDSIAAVVAAQSEPEISVEDLPAASGFSLRFDPALVPTYFTELGQGISKAKQEGAPWVGTPSEPAGLAYVDCDLNPCAALTFDDGPSEFTPQLLADLASSDAAATFYLLGQNAAIYPEIVKQIHDSGNELGNHSYSHPQLTGLSVDGVVAELSGTSGAIEEAAGVSPKTVRPPYGDWNETVLQTAQVPFIMWSIDTLDWQKPGAAALIDSVVYQSQPNDIILMHDIHQSTTSAVPQMLPLLNDRGYSLVTIDQLFGGELTGPTVVYSGDR